MLFLFDTILFYANLKCADYNDATGAVSKSSSDAVLLIVSASNADIE